MRRHQRSAAVDAEEAASVSQLRDQRERWMSKMVATCRDRSESLWLHYPHVELVFLFFAFQGATTSCMSAMRHARCPALFFAAVSFMVSGGLSVREQEKCTPLGVKDVLNRTILHVEAPISTLSMYVPRGQCFENIHLCFV